MTISWQTTAGVLFSTSTGVTINKTITATNAVSYTLISGTLPDGLTISSTGTIHGTILPIENTTTSTFVIRAANTSSLQDRTFKITILQDPTPAWSTSGFTVSTGTLVKLLVNRDYVEIPIDANSDLPVTYELDRLAGKLPYGLRIDSAGKIYGAPRLNLTPGEVKEFDFSVNAYNDANLISSQPFRFEILDSASFTVDSTVFTLGGDIVSLVDLGNSGTVSLSSLQPPEFINPNGLGTYLHDDKQYISVQAYDPNYIPGPITYSTVSGHLPSGLQLDSKIGYIYGIINSQSEYWKTYNFTVQATKTNLENLTTASSTGSFSINIVNQFYRNVVWPSSDMGTLIEGMPSELSVGATQKDPTWSLYYYHLIGNSTASGNFTFTIAASTSTAYTNTNLLTSSTLVDPVTFNTFNLYIRPVSKEYTRIWAKPFLTPTQRQLWTNFINSSSIFIPEILYRADDPTFGLQTDLEIFLEFGIEKVNIGDYADALYTNFYQRRLTFGTVKSAIAKDRTGKHVYDAVYVDVTDNLDGSKVSININNTVYYPGSIDNIRNSLESITLDDSTEIAVDGQHLPKFMTTVASGQEYGYFKAAILCYTLPGESKKILNRIRAAKFNFSNLNFFIDRLVVQSSLDQTGTSYILFNNQPVG